MFGKHQILAKAKLEGVSSCGGTFQKTAGGHPVIWVCRDLRVRMGGLGRQTDSIAIITSSPKHLKNAPKLPNS